MSASLRASTRMAGPAFLLGVYFLGLAMLVNGIMRWFPGLTPHLPFGGTALLTAEAASNMSLDDRESALQSLTNTSPLASFDALTLGFAISGAVALMLPISWVYFITTRSKKIDRSFAQTMIVLPIIVAAIATVVQNSLALAFSLAGIVAAVRFRFTLEEPAYALYVFVAIAVGLAAGIGALGIAYVTAIAFAAVNLILWRLDYGDDLTTPFFSFLTGRGRDDNEL